MHELICPFSAPLVKNDFACQHAQEIIRRGGSEIACQQMAAHAVCSKLHGQIKLAALAAMDLEDDLLTVPHNVLVKIQYGGLLGLQNLTAAQEKRDDKIHNVVSLVSQAEAQFGMLENIPLQTICETIIDYKVQRRRSK